MARIPTISASSITGLPGSAGGVKLNRTGVGAVPISTPLTQRLNPSQYGQEGAAMAQLGEAIFNEIEIPMIERRAANAKAKRSLEESTRLSEEMSSIKIALGLNVLPGREYRTEKGEIAAWDKHWNGINTRIDKLAPSINANIKDKRHALALSNAYMPQIMALKFKAQNRQVKVSEDNTILSYHETQKDILAEMMGLMPQGTKDKNGETVYIFEGSKIGNVLQRKELNDTIFENSGVNPLNRQKEIERARKSLIDEVAGSLQSDPRRGQAFLETYGEALGMTDGEVGEAIYKMERFAAQHQKWENDKLEAEEEKQENAARASLNAMVPLDDGIEVTQMTKLKMDAHAGELNLPDFYKTWANIFHEAGYDSQYTKIEQLIKPTDTASGETKPGVYSDYKDKVALALGNPDITDDEIDILEDQIIAENKNIARGDRLELVKELSVLKTLSDKNPRYKLAKDLLSKQAPVAEDRFDTTPAALRSRAIWNTWLTNMNELRNKNNPAAWRKYDFFGRAKEIINQQSDLYSNPSGEGAQILLKENVRKFGNILGDDKLQISVSPNKDSKYIYPDVSAMQVQLQNSRETMNPEQVKRALAVIRTIEDFPGLSAKVTDIKKTKEAEAQARDQEERIRLKDKAKSEKQFQDRTPDQIEKMIEENFPNQYKKYFGEGKQTEPEVKPEVKPIPEPEIKPEVKTEPEPEQPKPVPETKKTSVATDNYYSEVLRKIVEDQAEISEIADQFNVDPDKMVELIEPMFKEMGGLDIINQALAQAAEQRASEAQVLARRKENKRKMEERQVEKEQLLQTTKKEAAKKSATGLEDKKKYPDKRLLERLQDLQFRSFNKELSAIEKKEMETIEKEVKARKLEPLALG